MLEPGTRMLKWIGILVLAGVLLYLFHFRMVAFCIWAVSGIIFAVLLILLAVEAHQDNVMNEIAIEEYCSDFDKSEEIKDNNIIRVED